MNTNDLVKFSHFPNHPEYRKLFWTFFQCDLCGKCCTKYLGVPLTRDDIRRLAAGLKMGVSEFEERHTTRLVGHRLLKMPCAFLVEGACTVHDFSSENCRLYPLISCVCTDHIEHLGVRLNCPRASAALEKLEQHLISYRPAYDPK